MKFMLAIDHVSLIVADTERALGFYRDILGLETMSERPDFPFPGAWLRLGEQQIHLLELPNPDPVNDRPAHVGRDRHLALRVGDLEAVIAQLRAAGIHPMISQSGRKAVFCRDPDGNGIEFLERT